MGCKLAKASTPASADKVATGEKQTATDAVAGNNVLLGKSKTVNMLGAQLVNTASDTDAKKPQENTSTVLIEKVDGDQARTAALEDSTSMPTNTDMASGAKPQDEQADNFNPSQPQASVTARAAGSDEADSKQLAGQMGGPLDPSNTSGANSQMEPPAVANSAAEGDGAGVGTIGGIDQASALSTVAQQEVASNLQTQEVEGQGQGSQKIGADSQGNQEKKRKQREPCCGC